jgi:hypothetical protein
MGCYAGLRSWHKRQNYGFARIAPKTRFLDPCLLTLRNMSQWRRSLGWCCVFVCALLALGYFAFFDLAYVREGGELPKPLQAGTSAQVQIDPGTILLIRRHVSLARGSIVHCRKTTDDPERIGVVVAFPSERVEPKPTEPLRPSSAARIPSQDPAINLNRKPDPGKRANKAKTAAAPPPLTIHSVDGSLTLEPGELYMDPVLHSNAGQSARKSTCKPAVALFRPGAFPNGAWFISLND